MFAIPKGTRINSFIGIILVVINTFSLVKLVISLFMSLILLRLASLAMIYLMDISISYSKCWSEFSGYIVHFVIGLERTK